MLPSMQNIKVGTHEGTRPCSCSHEGTGYRDLYQDCVLATSPLNVHMRGLVAGTRFGLWLVYFLYLIETCPMNSTREGTSIIWGDRSPLVWIPVTSRRDKICCPRNKKKEFWQKWVVHMEGLVTVDLLQWTCLLVCGDLQSYWTGHYSQSVC